VRRAGRNVRVTLNAREDDAEKTSGGFMFPVIPFF